ncbi:TolC family protein [Estrella lausannensis]|uniref:TolC family protein n=1 Tax=Estrella lausannensis TaxID=483423 RepID=UPI001304375E|nr:TolC family protein [Estrella lausannensis]
MAVASFFPSFTLIGDAGYQSLKLKNLFDAKSTTWAYSGDVSIPVFQGGSLIGNLRAQEAEQIRAALFYQKSVLTAVSEAETYLKQYKEDSKRVKDLLLTQERYRNLNILTEERYQKGLVSKLDYIRSKIELIQSDEELLQSETSSLLSLIMLYKALGGGWHCCQP